MFAILRDIYKYYHRDLALARSLAIVRNLAITHWSDNPSIESES
jgi:hypothetical protein